MGTTVKEQYLFMVLYLMTKFSNKRQGIQEKANDITVQYPLILNDIISSIYCKYHFDLNSVTTNDDCLKAESILSNYLSSIVKDDLSSSIEDESMLLRESIELKKEELIPAKVILNNELKELFSKLKISKSAIESWFLTPDYIRYFKVQKNENILATRIIPYKSTKKVLFYHMNVQRNFSSIYEYKICTTLVFDYELFKDMISSPVRLYLFILDRYGINMNLNGEVKKLFFKVKQPSQSSIKVNSKSNNLYTCWQTFNTPQGENYLSFVYSIDLESYLLDFKKREI